METALRSLVSAGGWLRGNILLLCILLECVALLLCLRALIELYCIKEQGKREGNYSPCKSYKVLVCRSSLFDARYSNSAMMPDQAGLMGSTSLNRARSPASLDS
jgi:hypothetical protein